MKNKIKAIYFLIAFSTLTLTSCSEEGPQGPAGRDATVYYSEWFSPSGWSGTNGDWYFIASAPDLTADVVENGVVLAYCWLAGDIYDASTVRPLPAYAIGANWSYLISNYSSIEFTSDMIAIPSTTHKFRFIAIPGTITALKSTSPNVSDLKKMSYRDVCKMFNIPE